VIAGGIPTIAIPVLVTVGFAVRTSAIEFAVVDRNLETLAAARRTPPLAALVLVTSREVVAEVAAVAHGSRINW